MKLSLLIQFSAVLGTSYFYMGHGYQQKDNYNNRLWNFKNYQPYFEKQPLQFKKATQKPSWKNEMSKLYWKNPMFKSRWQDPMSKPQWQLPMSNWWSPTPAPVWQDAISVPSRKWTGNIRRNLGKDHPGYNSRVWPSYIPPIRMIKLPLDDPPDF